MILFYYFLPFRVLYICTGILHSFFAHNNQNDREDLRGILFPVLGVHLRAFIFLCVCVVCLYLISDLSKFFFIFFCEGAIDALRSFPPSLRSSCCWIPRERGKIRDQRVLFSYQRDCRIIAESGVITDQLRKFNYDHSCWRQLNRDPPISSSLSLSSYRLIFHLYGHFKPLIPKS